MYVKVETQTLVSALQAATAAAAQSAGGLIELSAEGDKLVIRGTDGELFVQRSPELKELVTEGKAIVAGPSLLGLVRESASEETVLKAAAGKLRVRCGAGRYELLCAAGATVPQAPSESGSVSHIEAAALARLFELTAFAASSREIRYAMNGVCLSTKGKLLSGAATDGRRLAVAKARVDSGFKGQVIVPLRAVAEIIRLLSALTGEAELHVGQNYVAVAAGGGEVATRLIEGRFPAYGEVIPKDNAFIASMGKEELGRAMKSAPFLSGEESRATKLSFSAKGVTVEFGSPQQGEGRMELPAECTEGEVTVWLSPRFVLDVLRVLAEETVQMALRDSESAVVFREGEHFLYVLMPVSPREGSGSTES